MHIVVFSHSYSGDGASQMLLLAAHHWVRDLGWSVDAVVPRNLSPEAKRNIADCGMKPIERALFSVEYDIALINCVQNMRFVELLLGRWPVLLWAHEGQTAIQSCSWGEERWRELFAGTDCVVFQTQAQHELYQAWIPNDEPSRVAVIPNALPPIGYDVYLTRDTRTRPMHIVSVGEVTPMKGQADLVRAVVEISAMAPVHCELIGGVDMLDRLDPVALGFLRDRPDLFTMRGHLARDLALKAVASADVFCFPSHAESFGLAPLEAASLGVPVILADLDVYLEIGWVHGLNCVKHPIGNIAELAQAMLDLRLQPDRREALVRAAHQLLPKFTMSTFLQTLTACVQRTPFRKGLTNP